ncbi:TonB-dependent receptor domain-containing protein [Methyloglobulus sp.]|uniref:TonB-dependent receptor domain-containing protein n=1 Tax=Methyloglobulus sp. TaxID=2518622 RepID=UPI003989FF4B
MSLFKIPTILLAVNSDWSHGFHHPLQGWDHLLTMIAVGIWAAQLRGVAIWMLPLTFVSVMSLGGLAGAASFALPSVEIIILLSGLVFSVFVVRKVRFTTRMNVLIVAFFAFFHGYVHGQEISASASLISYTLGFVIATLLLHGAGIAAARLMTLSFAFFLGSNVHAQETEVSATDTAEASVTTESKAGNNKGSVELEEMTITGRADSQVGIADSASQGNVGQAQLKYRPISRPGEVLETVPGLIATQHSGEGKANQYFLRGFNLDHGTDFLTQVDGVPVNQLSHSHGQGWTDTNFLIPELIETLDYKKGSNYAENGDFSSTGSANIHYFRELPQNIIKFTGGSFDYYRGMVAGSHKLGDGNLLYAGETVYNNGPWTVGNEYLKFNGVLRYSEEHGDHGWSITGMASKADWKSTDQIARRAVNQGIIGRFDALDPTDGGDSQRYSLTGEWHRQDAESETKLMTYGVYSKLNLFSNFTYFLDNNEFTNPTGCAGLASGKFDPTLLNTCGDQFSQPDDRWTTGLKGTHTLFHKIGAADSETTFGLQIRNDNIQNALTKTHAQKQYDITRQDTVWVTSISPYAENKTHWNDWLRTSLGVRFDGFRFDVSNSNVSQNNGERYDGLVSPKLGIVFGPWADTEFYLNGGLGYHSNDARGVLTTVDPATGDKLDSADPLVRTYSAEVGVRSTWVKGLQSTLAIWWLDIDSELLFVGDAGTTVASRPSRRYGLEFANYYSPTDWLTFDADLSFSHSRFRNDVLGEGNHIPNSVETVIAAGATFHDVYGGFFGGPRLRFFGPRTLIEDNSKRSESTLLVSAMLGYEINKNLSFQAEVFNILDRKNDTITYFYTSRLPGENSAGVDDFHFHPVEPLSFRLGFTAKF